METGKEGIRGFTAPEGRKVEREWVADISEGERHAKQQAKRTELEGKIVEAKQEQAVKRGKLKALQAMMAEGGTREALETAKIKADNEDVTNALEFLADELARYERELQELED